MKKNSLPQSIKHFSLTLVLIFNFFLPIFGYCQSQGHTAASKTTDTKTTGTQKKSADTVINSFTYLNAASFDVTGIGKTGYLGHANVFHYPEKGKNWGYNSGLMKINYNPDSSSKRLEFRNITIDPLKPVNVGSQYYKQSSYVSTIISKTAYNLYVQPMYQLLIDDDGNRILVHAHAELLVFNTTAITRYSNTTQEAFTFTAKDSANRTPIYRGNPTDTSAYTYRRSQLNGYFGGGMTFVLKPGVGTFYFQGTIGVTDNYPNFQSLLGTPNPIFHKWNSFYLVKANYSAKLGDNTTLILGTDIRGLFPDYAPLYAIYIGLNVNMDALGKLFATSTK